MSLKAISIVLVGVDIITDHYLINYYELRFIFLLTGSMLCLRVQTDSLESTAQNVKVDIYF